MKKNKSITYLFPLINDILELDVKFYYKYVLNTYIFSDEDKGRYFYLLLKFNEEDEDFLEKESYLTQLSIYSGNTDIDQDTVLFKFEFPKSYHHEYDKFIEGKYSEFKLDAKTIILKFFNKLYDNNSANNIAFLVNMKHILFKDDKLRKKLEEELNVNISTNAELSSIIDKDKETVKLNLKYESKN
jgi:hypothetical protein